MRTDRLASRANAVARWIFLGVLLSLARGDSRAEGQAEVRNITQPIPVVDSGGHHAPVRVVLFTRPDGAFLLSAGMDKVIHVWDLRGPRPGLARTIRPRIWRGPAGVLYAMALSPAADAAGHSLLAVAGYGVDNNQGEIKIYRFPGSPNRPTGDLVAQLPSGGGEQPPLGHLRTVACLAFDPTGRYLASGSADTTVRVWDLANPADPTTVATFRGHVGAVNALTYTPDGRRLLTGGSDGLVILWDLDRRAEIARAVPDPARHRDDRDGAAINTQMLAITPDGRLAVIGRENGDLVRYNAADLTGATLLNPRPANTHGAVESLAIGPDGATLAASIVSRALTDPARRPRVECHVELRRLPDGSLVRRLPDASNLIYALAFSPDGRRLAYAGGDTQAITISDLTDPAVAPVELAGQGSSIWDVGFAREGRAIGFSRARTDLGDPPAPFEDFDLSGQRVRPFDPAELSRAIPEWNGWSVRPVGPYRIDVLNAAGPGFTVSLDPVADRRWWSSSFLPPGPGHPRPTLAVGCEAGVVIYSLESGRRTRLFAGHEGAPIYAMAPSPDGVWLATGSSDQTVRLWRLDGCDTPPALGARFEPDGAALGRVASVDRRSFAESSGMQVGDVIESAFVGMDETKDLKAFDGLTPGIPIAFRARRQGQPLTYGSTRRDGPALTLFPARDREWVLWSPLGLYETSPLGDRRYLAWHRNPGGPLRPTDHFAFDRYERELRRPDAIAQLLRTADLDALRPQAAPDPQAQALVATSRLPDVEVDAPGRRALDTLVLPGVALPLRVRAARQAEDAEPGQGLVRSVRVLVDGGRAVEVAVDPPSPTVDRQINLDLTPGRHRVSVEAVNDRGRERVEGLEVVAQEPPRPVPAELEPRLFVLAVGASGFSGGPSVIPPIPFGAEDGRDVSRFLAAPGGTSRHKAVEVRTLIGPEATSDRILAALADLDGRRDRAELGRGDSVFLWIESHLIDVEGKGSILGADAADSPGAQAVHDERLAETLGRLAEYGCRVVVFVDLVHEKRPASPRAQRMLNAWIRALYARNVVAFVASIHGPSRRHLTHGVFAESVLRSLNVRGEGSPSVGAPAPLSLDEFQERISLNALALTGRQQFARCYIPGTLSGSIPIFEPPARRPAKGPAAAR
jgi:WD40 repeat protein